MLMTPSKDGTLHSKPPIQCSCFHVKRLIDNQSFKAITAGAHTQTHRDTPHFSVPFSLLLRKQMVAGGIFHEESMVDLDCARPV